MSFTKHQIRKYEQKGKAANVSWCVENMGPIFEKYFIQPESVMLTVIDSDSWTPDIYVDVLEQKMIEDGA